MRAQNPILAFTLSTTKRQEGRRAGNYAQSTDHTSCARMHPDVNVDGNSPESNRLRLSRHTRSDAFYLTDLRTMCTK